MNPKTKVFLFGNQIRTAAGRFDSFKAAAKRFIRKTLIATAVAATGVLLFFGGQLYSTYVEMNTVSVAFASTTIVQAPSPILDRIADCESGNGQPGSASQTGKDGQVIIHVNGAGLGYDIGKYQINSTHGAEATKLGDNLYTVDGNTAYAKYLYANRGTGDWASSQHCWSR